MGRQRNWSREELILAYELYCRVPMSKMNKNHREVVALAEKIGRTPSSVNFKLGNLASFDPEMKAKGVNGLGHGGKLDREIFFEFHEDMASLRGEAEKALEALAVRDSKPVDVSLPEGSTRETEIDARVGQDAFREAVLSSYRYACCVTGLREPEILNASHIKPWAVADPKTERTNPRNGLCLNALHDKCFDRGLITIDDRYRIVVSRKLEEAEMDPQTRVWIESYAGREIIKPERFLPDRKFIEYHNDVIFQG